jgi:hypothetical protein
VKEPGRIREINHLRGGKSGLIARATSKVRPGCGVSFVPSFICPFVASSSGLFITHVSNGFALLAVCVKGVCIASPKINERENLTYFLGKNRLQR